MRYSRKNLPKTRLQFEEFMRENELRPYGQASYKGRTILLAESDLIINHPREDAPWGFYQTVWAVMKPDSDEKMDICRPIDFSAMHDTEENWTPEAKRDARIQTTINDAMQFIDKSIEAGRLDA